MTLSNKQTAGRRASLTLFGHIPPLGRYWLQSGRVSVGLPPHFEQR
jgi:hypothetical protein